MKRTVGYWLILSLVTLTISTDAQEKEHSPAVQAIFDTMLSHFKARGMEDHFNPLLDGKYDIFMETPWSPPVVERLIGYRVGIREFSNSGEALTDYTAQIKA